MICDYGEDLKRELKLKFDTRLCTEEATHKGFCEKHIPHDLRRVRDYEATPFEKRQQFLDHVWSGKTIGEAYEAAGISFEVACEVMNRAIVNNKLLKKEAER